MSSKQTRRAKSASKPATPRTVADVTPVATPSASAAPAGSRLAIVWTPDPLVTALLAGVAGQFGLHRFYEGRFWSGLAYVVAMLLGGVFALAASLFSFIEGARLLGRIRDDASDPARARWARLGLLLMLIRVFAAMVASYLAAAAGQGLLFGYLEAMAGKL